MVVIPAPGSLNLLTAAWLPVHSSTGARMTISPAQIAQAWRRPIVALAWGRPDFDVASMELMITNASKPDEIDLLLKNLHRLSEYF